MGAILTVRDCNGHVLVKSCEMTDESDVLLIQQLLESPNQISLGFVSEFGEQIYLRPGLIDQMFFELKFTEDLESLDDAVEEGNEPIGED